MKYNYTLWFLFFLFIFISCIKTNPKLNDAETIMETSPDSSLHILQRIDQKTIRGAYNRALYSLLMSQALDKNDIKSENDSLIRIATGYFDESDPIHAGYAWFYHSRTANNRDSINEQAGNLLKAQEYAEQTNDYKLRGLIYGEKGQMYKNQQQYDSSICYFKCAYNSFKYLPDKRNEILCLFYIGDNFLYLSKCDSALKYYKSAEKLLAKTNDKLILSSLYRNIGTIYFQLNDFNQALYYYMLAPDTKIHIYDSNKYYLIAKTFIQINEIDSARKYLGKVTELQSMAPDYYRLWQAIYKKQGNTQQYILYASKENLAIDSLYKKKLETSFAGLEKKYKYQGLQFDIQKLTIKNNQRGIFLLVLLLALSVFSVVFLFWRLRVKKNEVEYQKDIANKKQKLLEIEQEKTEKERENKALLEHQLKLQNILLSNIKIHQNNSVKRPNVWKDGSYQTIDKQYEAFFNELKTYIDMEFNNFSLRLKEKFTNLSERDIQFCCLLLANFETGMIATILNVNNHSIIVQRSRLRSKLNLVTSDNLFGYLSQF